MPERGNSSALAMRLSCTKPSLYRCVINKAIPPSCSKDVRIPNCHSFSFVSDHDTQIWIYWNDDVCVDQGVRTSNGFDHDSPHGRVQGAVSIRKTVLPGMAIPMLKIRRPNGRLIFNMEIAIRR